MVIIEIYQSYFKLSRKLKISIYCWMLYSAFFSIALFLPGCSKNEKPDIFNTTINLKGTTLIRSAILHDPWSILTIDSLVIVGNKKGQPLIEIYNKKGKILKRLVARGKAPDQILAIGAVQADSIHHRFFVFDLFKKTIIEFSLDGLLNMQNYHPQLFVDFKRLNLSDNLVQKAYVRGNNYLIESGSGNGRFLFLNNDGHESKFFGKFPPKVDPTLTDEENAHLYTGEIAISPDNKKMAFASFTAGLLDFYDLKDSEIVPKWLYTEFLPTDLKRIQFENMSAIAFSNKSVEAYLDVTSTNKFVYAIYSGKTLEYNQSGLLGWKKTLHVCS
jgi:hypothetical protein